jgi:hypothetical protein
MKFNYLILALASSVGLYGWSTASVIAAKRAELRFILHQSTLLNYEIAGRVLTGKLWRRLSGQSDFEADVRNAALEGGVFSAPAGAIEPSFLERSGIRIENLLRKLNREAPINYDASIRRHAALRVAFSYEMRNDCSTANRAYSQALEDHALFGDEFSFALVHRAYCRAMLGDIDNALSDVRYVRENLPRSRHVRDAETIEAMLLAADRGMGSASRLSDRAEILPEDMFRRGAFRSVIGLLANRRDRSAARTLLLAQSYEYSGETEAAVAEYLKLIKSGSREQSIQANRRLLYISQYSGGGARLEAFAKERARSLGDGESLEKMERILAAARALRAPGGSAADATPPGGGVAAFRESSIDRIVAAATRDISQDGLPGRVLVGLIDGRQLDAERVVISDNRATLMWRGETTTVSLSMIKNVRRADIRPLNLSAEGDQPHSVQQLSRDRDGYLSDDAGRPIETWRSWRIE